MATKPSSDKIKGAADLTNPKVTGTTDLGEKVMSAIINDESPQAQAMAAQMADAGVVTLNQQASRAAGRALYDYDPGRITDIGNYVMSYDKSNNPFLLTMLNRIFSTIVETLQFNNPWARFKMGYVEYGDTMEESYIDPADVFRFDPEGAQDTVFKREMPKVHTAFHRMNCQIFHKTTVQQQGLKQAFLTPAAWGDFISKQLQTLIVAGEYDEWNIMKYMVGNAVLKGWIKPVSIDALPSDQETSQDFLAQLNTDIDNFQLPSYDRNLAGVLASTHASQLAFIQTNAQFEQINVKALATLFNEQYAAYSANRAAIDSFTNLDWDRLTTVFTNPATGEVDGNFAKWTSTEEGYLATLGGILLDERWFHIWDNLEDSGAIYNPQGLYWNYTHHMWRTFSFSPFHQAIAYVANPVTPTTVTLSPSAVTLSAGDSQTFTAKVAGASGGIVDQAVSWSLTGAASKNTTIIDGTLFLGPDETGASGSLTVKATSVAAPTVSGTAAVTIE